MQPRNARNTTKITKKNSLYKAFFAFFEDLRVFVVAHEENNAARNA